jgi:hypothetical protein
VNVIQHADGVKTLFDFKDGEFVMGTEQDCTAIHEDAQKRQNEGMTGTSEMRHAARFPLVLIETYCNQAGITFDQWMQDKTHLRRMLADPDLKGFRIWQGRVA